MGLSMNKIIEKIPSWVFSFSVFGLFILISVSIYFERPFTIAGWDFGARTTVPMPKVLDKSKNTLPLGIIIPFYGDPKKLEGTGWVVCDGRNLTKESIIDIDADPILGGKQLPDLRGRFIQGLSSGENLFMASNSLHTGGNDQLNLQHSHKWVVYNQKNWKSYNATGNQINIGGWNDGIGNDGKGHYPLYLKTSSSMNLHTEKSGQVQIDNRPSFIKLHYIIKIF